MMKITVDSHRHDEPTVEWIINALKFKQIRFKKYVIMLPDKKSGKTHYETVIEKVEM